MDTIVPNCQPFASPAAKPVALLAKGMLHTVLNRKLCRMSNAATPRSVFRLWGSRGAPPPAPLRVDSTPTCPWVSSIVFENVYALWKVIPWVMRFSTFHCRPLYQELPPAEIGRAHV